MAKANREQWRQRVEQWKQSGLTAREYAAQAGLNAGTFATGSGDCRAMLGRNRHRLGEAP